MALHNELAAFWISHPPLYPEEVGRAEFTDLAAPTYVTVAYSVRWFINKTHFKLLQEGFKVEPRRISG